MMRFEDLRQWQKEFAAAYRRHDETDFLLVCLPGGGKTIASLVAAGEWLRAARGRPRLVIHVSPLAELKRQFRNSAARLGLQFQTAEWSGTPKAGMNGVCLTYCGMAASAASLRTLAARFELMVIFDEPHHMSEEAAWGRAATEAFAQAVRRLFMTGTPWRHDMTGIPFASKRRREDGSYIADYTFDWPRALKAAPRPIRILSFRPFDDVVIYENRDTHAIQEMDSRDFPVSPSLPASAKSDQDLWLNRAIHGEAMITGMVGAAHKKLMEVRAHKRDAAGLIVCESQAEAARVAGLLRKVTAVTPHLIVSDDDISSTTLKDFENEEGTWIVAVRKVSEGIDIPRLIVGVFLSNYRTELYFRQFVGRVARNQNTKFDGEAYVFIPKHWMLMEYARKIEEIQAIALRAPQDGGHGGAGGAGRTITYLGDRDAGMSGVLLPNTHMETSDVATLDQVMAHYRPLGMTETLAAQLLRDGKLGGSWTPPPDKARDEPSLEEKLAYYRKKVIQPKVRRLAFMSGAADDEMLFRTITAEMNGHAGTLSVKEATLEQLQAMSAWLDDRLSGAKFPGPGVADTGRPGARLSDTGAGGAAGNA